MTVTTITNGELFTVRVYKRFGNLLWGNNYELRATQDVPFAQTAIQDVVNRLADLETAIHTVAVTIDRAVFSTYVRDSVPYNPQSFTTIPIAAQGQYAPGGDYVPLEYCLFVRRVVASGRTGKLLYRGCLAESDVGVDGYRAVMVNPRLSQLQTAFNSWFASFLSGGNPFEMVMASGDETPSVRVVQGLSLNRRIVLKQVGNAYFDRRP